jgi:hypothetical protein
MKSFNFGYPCKVAFCGWLGVQIHMKHASVHPLAVKGVSQLGLVGTVDFSRERLVGLNSTAASAK